MSKEHTVRISHKPSRGMKIFLLMLIALLSVCVLITAFSACSKNEQSNIADNTASASVASASSPAAQPTPVKTTQPETTPSKSAENTGTSTPNPTPTAKILPLSGHVIGLDPGHQAHANSSLEPVSPGSTHMKKKVSSGTRGRFTRVYEYVVNLQVALKLKTKLEALGAKVVMTHETKDVNISNAQRAQMMNNAGVDCWLRIHANGNTDASVHGMETLVPKSGCLNTSDTGVYDASIRLAKALQSAAASSSGAKNLELSYRSDQTGFNWSSIPVCNIEMGYMTNETEDNALTSGSYQDKIVDGLAQGFVDYFGV